MNRRREPLIRRDHKWKDLAAAAAALHTYGLISVAQVEAIYQSCRRQAKAEARDKDRGNIDHK